MYGLSAGPVFFSLSFVKEKKIVDTDAIKIPVIVLYFPHFFLASRAEWYFDYLNWCVSLAGGRTGSYEQFKRDFPL